MQFCSKFPCRHGRNQGYDTKEVMGMGCVEGRLCIGVPFLWRYGDLKTSQIKFSRPTALKSVEVLDMHSAFVNITSTSMQFDMVIRR